MQAQLNLKEILVKRPEQITKEDLTAIIKILHSQNPALSDTHPGETAQGAAATGSLVVGESSGGELDDEYLPACCRNGNPHHHLV